MIFAEQCFFSSHMTPQNYRARSVCELHNIYIVQVLYNTLSHTHNDTIICWHLYCPPESMRRCFSTCLCECFRSVAYRFSSSETHTHTRAHERSGANARPNEKESIQMPRISWNDKPNYKKKYPKIIQNWRTLNSNTHGHHMMCACVCVCL